MDKLKENKLEKSIEKGIDKITTTSTKGIKKGIKKITNPKLFRKKKVGLVLGGGAAKGLTHIGVLKILEKNNVQIDMIAGTSVGALIGAFYGVYQNAKEIEKIISGFEFKKYIDVKIPKTGLIKGDKLEGFLREKLNNSSFEDLKIPLFVCATDLLENRQIIFNSGNLVAAIRASISIPGLFFPTQVGKRILVDGGLKDPLPIDILKENGCDIIIAVNLDTHGEKEPVYEKALVNSNTQKLPNIIDVSIRSYEIMEREVARLRRGLDGADILIEPNVSANDFFRFDKRKKLIRKGELATEKKIKKIKRIVKRSLI